MQQGRRCSERQVLVKLHQWHGQCLHLEQIVQMVVNLREKNGVGEHCMALWRLRCWSGGGRQQIKLQERKTKWRRTRKRACLHGGVRRWLGWAILPVQRLQFPSRRHIAGSDRVWQGGSRDDPAGQQAIASSCTTPWKEKDLETAQHPP